MAPIDRKQQVERRMLGLLEDHGMPPPDDVEYGERCVRFLWHDLKVAVVVEVDDFEAIDADGGYTTEGLVM